MENDRIMRPQIRRDEMNFIQGSSGHTIEMDESQIIDGSQIDEGIKDNLDFEPSLDIISQPGIDMKFLPSRAKRQIEEQLRSLGTEQKDYTDLKMRNQRKGAVSTLKNQMTVDF